MEAALNTALQELGMQWTTIDGVDMRVFRSGPQTLHQFYADTADKHRDKPCLIDDGVVKQYTFSGLLSAAQDFAAFLIVEHEVKPGDRVAIAARNSTEWVISFLGATLFGAVAVPLNAWWKTSELQRERNRLSETRITHRATTTI